MINNTELISSGLLMYDVRGLNHYYELNTYLVQHQEMVVYTTGGDVYKYVYQPDKNKIAVHYSSLGDMEEKGFKLLVTIGSLTSHLNSLKQQGNYVLGFLSKRTEPYRLDQLKQHVKDKQSIALLTNYSVIEPKCVMEGDKEDSISTTSINVIMHLVAQDENIPPRLKFINEYLELEEGGTFWSNFKAVYHYPVPTNSALLVEAKENQIYILNNGNCVVLYTVLTSSNGEVFWRTSGGDYRMDGSYIVRNEADRPISDNALNILRRVG